MLARRKANRINPEEMMERTLVIIKPDAVKKNVVGDIIRRFEDAGLRILGVRALKLSKKEAEGFYYVHKEKAFFDSLTTFMSSGPVVAMVLEGEQAIKRVRELMGNTNSRIAEDGTIRKAYGTDIEKNAVHGSDSASSANFEIPYFFNSLELFPER